MIKENKNKVTELETQLRTLESDTEESKQHLKQQVVYYLSKP